MLSTRAVMMSGVRLIANAFANAGRAMRVVPGPAARRVSGARRASGAAMRVAAAMLAVTSGLAGRAWAQGSTLVRWGSSSFGQTNTPSDLGSVTQVACGSNHTYALKNDGTLVGWGDNGSGQTNTPSNLTGVTQVACGYAHTYALRSDGTLVGWGANEQGQTNTPRNETQHVRAVSCGSGFTIALHDVLDANQNHLIDACKLVDNPSLDRNANGIIDILEIARNPALDCNHNKVLDTFDLLDHPEWDCDANARPDTCDIAGGAPDDNVDGHIDWCSYAKGDFDLSGEVDTGDMSILLLCLGDGGSPIGDFDGDGIITTADLSLLLMNFGPVTWP